MGEARLEGGAIACHGHCYGFEAERATWAAPRRVAAGEGAARPGYDGMTTSVYEEEADTLDGKVRALARMVRQARHCIVYSGAGLSTAAGIDDYAIKAGTDPGATPAAAPGTAFASPFCAQPTLAHRVLVALHAAGRLHYWVQQNHDGLPQKAGMPQQCINEIHGAWHDPTNPVVPMSGELRGDLLADLREHEQRADLVMAVGTSLCGMNADSIVCVPARRAASGAPGQQGAVIVGVQQTVHDESATLRVFARCDEVFAALAKELDVAVPPPLPEGEFWVPPALAGRGEEDFVFENLGYDAAGQRSGEATISLDLREDAELVITGGMHAGAVGEVGGVDREGNFRCRFKLRPKKGKLRATVQMLLGRWWVQAVADGAVPYVPVVNKPADDAPGEAAERLRELMRAYAAP